MTAFGDGASEEASRVTRGHRGLDQKDWCPCEKRKIPGALPPSVPTQRTGHVRTQEEALSASQGGSSPQERSLPAPRSGTSSLQTVRKYMSVASAPQSGIFCDGLRSRQVGIAYETAKSPWGWHRGGETPQDKAPEHQEPRSRENTNHHHLQPGDPRHKCDSGHCHFHRVAGLVSYRNDCMVT